MNMNEAISATNRYFKYAQRDNGWDAAKTGDCEDYSFCVFMEMADYRKLRFCLLILSPKYRFHHVEVNGVGHFVTEVKRQGFFDNIFKKIVQKEQMEKSGYVFKYSYTKYGVLIRLLLT